MRKGAVLSGLLHVAIALVAIFGLPSLFNPPEAPQPIPVEVVTLAELTTPPKVEEAPTPAPAPPEPPKPEPPEPEPPKPEPPKPAAQQAPPPPPPPPEPEPVPPPAVAPPEPEPKPEPELAKVEPKPTPPAKPKPPPKPAEPDITSVLKNVEKLKQQAARQPAPEETPQPEAAPRSLVDQPLTMSEVDAIRRQIERCWNVPAGARDAENLVVEIRVRLNPDGSVFQAEILDIDRMARDGFYRAAAESARRAVLQCSPLQLPPKKYSLWKVVTLRFNPREMFGT